MRSTHWKQLGAVGSICATLVLCACGGEQQAPADPTDVSATTSALSNATSVTRINPDTATCTASTFIDFESFAEFSDLSGVIVDGVKFGVGWSVLVEGSYLNDSYASQGTHVAYPTQDGGLRLDFVNGPVSTVSVLVATGPGAAAYLEAYSSRGALLARAGPTNENYGTGLVDKLEITRSTADIAYVMVRGSGSAFTMDGVCADARGYKLSVKYVGSGQGSVAGMAWDSCAATGCTGYAPKSSTVMLTATPADANSVFMGWSGCSWVTAQNACAVPMYSDKIVNAKFEPAKYPLSVSISGTGGVYGTTTVGTSAPQRIDWSTCGPDPKSSGGTLCTADIANGAIVSLTAAPAPSATFRGWGVVCTGTTPCSFKMNSAKNPWAMFTVVAWVFDATNYMAAELAVLDRTQFPTLNRDMCGLLCLLWGPECVAASWCDETTPYGYANKCVLRSAADRPHQLQGVVSWLRPGTVVTTPPPATESSYGFYDVLQGNTKWTGWVPVWAQRIEIPAATTLHRLGAVTNHTTPQLRMALYADASGSPGALLAQTAFTPSVIGRNELAIGGAAGVGVAAGAYWVALQFDSDIGYLMGGAVSPTAPRAYADVPVTDPLPATFVLYQPIAQLEALNLYAVGLP